MHHRQVFKSSRLASNSNETPLLWTWFASVAYPDRFSFDHVDVLSFGDEDAQALGLHVERTRWLVLMAVAMILAAVLAVAGVVGWIGLVVPHFARMLVGPGHGALLPASAALGAIYLLIIDNIARSATAAEIPLGILTALIGAPVFAVLLRRAHMSGWQRD